MNDDYQERINRVLTYIADHSNQKLNLDVLAGVSNFSKYHFSRLFTSIVGMTPIAFVNRERLQRSITMLTETNITVLQVSIQCGFESVSTFNALFRKQYNMTPREIRSRIRNNSNFSLHLSNKQEELFSLDDYTSNRNNHLLRRAWDNMITIKELPDYEVAYVRHVGSYMNTGVAWGKLGRWAGENGLSPHQQYFIGISLDDLNEVDELACRYDACVTIPEGFDKQEHHTQVDFKVLSGGLYAVYPFYDTIDKFVLAYEHVFSLWLPASDYDADDKPCLEFCMNDPAMDKEGKAKVDLCIPIKKREDS
jgi:AraC family transcriptional regulator